MLMSLFCKIEQSFAKKLIPLRYKSIIMKKFLLSGSLLLIITTQINAQLTVTAELDDETFIYSLAGPGIVAVSYTHLRAHETVLDLVCRLLLEKKNNKHTHTHTHKKKKKKTIHSHTYMYKSSDRKLTV